MLQELDKDVVVAFHAGDKLDGHLLHSTGRVLFYRRQRVASRSVVEQKNDKGKVVQVPSINMCRTNCPTVLEVQGTLRRLDHARS